MRAQNSKPAEAGLPGDPGMFSVLTEINIIAQLSSKAFERRLPDNLSVAQFGVLNHLLRLDVVQTISEMASAFQVAQPTMSSTVKRLVEKSFVEIIPDKKDRRIKRVSVTPAGRAARERAVKAVAPHMASFQENAPEIDWMGMQEALMALRVYLDERR